MTEVLQSPSSSSSSSLQTHDTTTLFHSVNQESEESGGGDRVSRVTADFQHHDDDDDDSVKDRDNSHQLSLLAILLTLFRKSFWASSSSASSSNKNTAVEEPRLDLTGMEIGWPTDVRHVAHVTFDRFNGFLGLPVEFERDVPRRPPSASATVFGVSTESMQLSYDSRGNSVPTILLLMQQRLYSLGGLQAEGIFRITAENSQEEHLRNQLNCGIVPDGIDVHCLAGLIKAWFRELPTGVLDSLSPDQVMQCRSEDDCSALVRLLPPTENALLDWAINLMADVVQHEHQNKMNSHNIAMVFAPNMTQVIDPLTALMHAVQVMNFLKTLITKTLREREDAFKDSSCSHPREPSDENGHQGPPANPLPQNGNEENVEKGERQFIAEEDEHLGYLTATEGSNGLEFCNPTVPSPIEPKTQVNQLSDVEKRQPLVQVLEPVIEKTKGVCSLSCINPQSERIEAWR